MGLETIRQDINAVDRQLIALLEKRMVLADQVAAYKQVHDVPVLDQEREAEVLRSVYSRFG
ncbi:chorismate mutase, partial [Streptococcus equi subsp. zooepidemicus]|nr:chorismate mutase [Streptococcus equi subsp. zooepidemicus]